MSAGEAALALAPGFALASLCLTYFLGPVAGPSVALACTAATLCERPERWRLPESVALTWLAAFLGSAAALFNALYLQGGWPEVQAGWEALGAARRGDPWARLLPWQPLWAWVAAPGCLPATAGYLATAAAGVVLTRGLARRSPQLAPAAGCLAGPASLLLVCAAGCFLAPPDLPPEASAYTAMGLEEAMSLFGCAGGLGFALGLGTPAGAWLVRLAIGPTRTQADPAAPLPPHRPWVPGLAILLAGLAWWALAIWPARAVPGPYEPLAAELASGDPDRRLAALATIGQDPIALQARWREVLPCLEASEAAVRSGAAAALCGTPAAEGEVVAALSSQLGRETEPALREGVALTLASLIGWGAPVDREELLAILEREADPAVRARLVPALAELSTSAAVLGAIRRALTGTTAERQAALGVLHRVSTGTSRTLLEELLLALDDPTLAPDAAWLLGKSCSDSAVVVRALARAFERHGDPRIALGLQWSGAAAEPAVPALAAGLRDPDDAELLCHTLRAIGPPAREAVPALLELLRARRGRFPRYFALQTLEAIADPRAAPELRELVDDRDEAVASAARAALAACE